MAKKGSQKKDGSSRSGKRKTRGEYVEPQNMDDDIDSFHKQRDIIPLDVDADVGELSDDEEEPIFDDEAINNDEDEHDDEDEDDDDSQDNGLAAKIIKQQTFLRAKFGDFDDELQDEEEDEEGAQNIVWSGNRSHDYHGGDNRDIEAGKGFLQGLDTPQPTSTPKRKAYFPQNSSCKESRGSTPARPPAKIKSTRLNYKLNLYRQQCSWKNCLAF